MKKTLSAVARLLFLGSAFIFALAAHAQHDGSLFLDSEAKPAQTWVVTASPEIQFSPRFYGGLSASGSTLLNENLSALVGIGSGGQGFNLLLGAPYLLLREQETQPRVTIAPTLGFRYKGIDGAVLAGLTPRVTKSFETENLGRLTPYFSVAPQLAFSRKDGIWLSTQGGVYWQKSEWSVIPSLELNLGLVGPQFAMISAGASMVFNP